MSLADAVSKAGPTPPDDAKREDKKRYSELLSKYLAEEVAEGLRSVGFAGVKPIRGGPGEREFQGGLGPKKVDVAYSDERHGLLLAVSIKGINFPPFGKNLKNRFGDLCTEAITLHMRFPYSVVCALVVFPAAASADATKSRKISTFDRAADLFATMSGRLQQTDAGEKFENVTLMLYEPLLSPEATPSVTLVDAKTREKRKETDYFLSLRDIYNKRNPHSAIEE